MTYVPDKAWERYKNIINGFIDTDAGKQTFTWLKKLPQMASFGEDSNPVYIPITLEGLFHYNYIKTWANNRLRDTVSGELQYDDQVLYISKNQLETLGYLNEYGYWDFNWAEDRFIVRFYSRLTNLIILGIGSIAGLLIFSKLFLGNGAEITGDI